MVYKNSDFAAQAISHDRWINMVCTLLSLTIDNRSRVFDIGSTPFGLINSFLGETGRGGATEVMLKLRKHPE